MSKNKRSLDFVFIGLGEGGGRIADAFARLKYAAGAINTAQGDLAGLRLPSSSKLHIPIGAGGAGQDPAQGRRAVLEHEDRVRAFVQALTLTADQVMLCVGGGGGTGTGAVGEICRICRELKRPVGVIYTLPRTIEGTAVKANALQALGGLYQLSEMGEISPLVVVDNERIGALFPDLRLGQFWPKANLHLAGLFDAFNKLSAQKSEFLSALDGADYLRLLKAGKCAALGYAEITDLKSPSALARAVADAVHGGLLANGFDLSTASAVGIAIVGSANTLTYLPAGYLEAGIKLVKETVGGGYTFTGVYADSTVHRKLKLYTFFAGLDLPMARVGELAQEAQREVGQLQEKLAARTAPLAGLLGDGFALPSLERGCGAGVAIAPDNVFAQWAQ